MKLFDSPWHAWLAVIIIWISIVTPWIPEWYGLGVGLSYLIFYKK